MILLKVGILNFGVIETDIKKPQQIFLYWRLCYADESINLWDELS
jgi:hypothetical protein